MEKDKKKLIVRCVALGVIAAGYITASIISWKATLTVFVLTLVAETIDHIVSKVLEK